MNEEKRKALKKAGFRLGDAEEFLDMTDEERSILELRITLSKAVRRGRESLHLSQQQLAVKLGSSQSHIAKMESAAKDVSLDLLFRGLFAVGGKITDLTTMIEVIPKR